MPYCLRLKEWFLCLSNEAASESRLLGNCPRLSKNSSVYTRQYEFMHTNL